MHYLDVSNRLLHVGCPKIIRHKYTVDKDKRHPNLRTKRKKTISISFKSCQAACWPCADRSWRSRSSCSMRLLRGQTWSETFPSGISGTSRRMGCSYLLSPVSARWWSMCGPCLLAPTHGQIVWSQADLVCGNLPHVCWSCPWWCRPSGRCISLLPVARSVISAMLVC